MKGLARRFAKHVGVIGFFVLIVFLFFPQIFVFNHTFISTGMFYSDLYLFNYPVKALFHRSMLSGQGMPLWTDLIGNGYPLFAESQVGSSNLIHLFFFSLPIPTIMAFNYDHLIHYILGGIFCFIFLRKSVNLSNIASGFGSMVFIFCGFMISYLQHPNVISAVIYFPLNLFLVDQILKISSNIYSRKKDMYLRFVICSSILGFSIYLQLTTGHDESAYYNLLFLSVYFGLRLLFFRSLRQRLFLSILFLGYAVLVGLLLSSYQLLATYELVNMSNRESGLTYDHATWLVWPVETLILFINPHAYSLNPKELFYESNATHMVDINVVYPYLGLLPLGLIFYCIYLFLNKTLLEGRKGWFFVFISLLVLTYLYAIGASTELFSILWSVLPSSKFFRFPSKTLYIIEFCLAVISAIGFDGLIKLIVVKKGIRISFVVGSILFLIAFFDLWLINRPIQPTVAADYWLSTPPLVKEIQSEKDFCNCQDSYTNGKFQNWRVYSKPTFLKDSSRLSDIVLQKDVQNLDNSDFNMIYGVANIKEYAGLFVLRQDFLNRTTTLIDHATKSVKIPEETKKVWDLESTRFYLSDIPIDDPDLVLRKTEKYADKYDHRLDILQENGLTSIETDMAYLYESKHYYPRANLIPAKSAIYMKPDQNHAENILKSVISSDFDPSKNVIIDSDKDNSNLNGGNIESGEIGNYEFESYLPQNMKVRINVPIDSYFVLSDTFYPGWEALVDGKKAVIEKANYAFRAVLIPKGEHNLQMYYQPTFDKLGKNLTETGVGLFLIGASCFIFLKFGKMSRYEYH